MSNPILLIHGLWMTPRSWEKFTERYTTAGHEVHAPAWPGLEGDVEALRADSTPLASLSITKIVDHHERFIRGLDTAPIIMATPSAACSCSCSSTAVSERRASVCPLHSHGASIGCR
jgi:Alpha/beta hydrolase family